MTRKRLVIACSVLSLVLLAGCASILGGQETPASIPTADGPTIDQSTPTRSQTHTAARQTPNPTPTATPDRSTPATSTPTATASPTETPEYRDVDVEGGNFSVNEDRVYARVADLLDRDAEPPTVRVVDTIEFMEGPEPSMTNGFRLTFGFGREYIDASVYHGYTAPQRGEIVISPKNATSAENETILAHEFTHWLQFRGDPLISDEFGDFVDDTDSRQVQAGLTEGASVYLTDQYMDEYMTVSWNQTEALREQYERGPPGRRLFRARYRFGAGYIHETIEDPANLSWLYRPATPTPETSEQLIHGETPGTEPEQNITVSVSETDNWTVTGRDTKGEIVVRTTLRAELGESTAAPAASGWGSDEIVRFSHVDNRSREAFAWALRWDTATDADEFETAFDQWTTGRPGNDSATFRQLRLSDETVAVFAGDPGFVQNATASGTTSNVIVNPR